METSQRIAQIQDYLHNQADERFINLIYGMIKAELEVTDLSDAHKQILDQRLAEHDKNPSLGRSWDEIKAELLKNK